MQAQRGGEHSGFVHNSGSDDAAFDITLPTLSRAAPPSVGTSFDVVTDQESLAFYGTASEAVGKVTLTDGMVSAELFASSDDGRFLVRPVALGRLTAPRTYSLTLQDRAGNFAPGADLTSPASVAKSANSAVFGNTVAATTPDAAVKDETRM